MRKFVIAIMVFILCFAGVLLAVMILGIAGGKESFTLFTPELANRQTFSPREFSAIDVSYRSDSITILPSSNGEIIWEEYMSNWDDSMLATITQQENTLSIEQGDRSPLATGMFWSSKTILYLPASWQGDLAVETASGGIKSEGEITARSIRLTSSSGSVHTDSLLADTDIELHTNSGSLRPGTIKGKKINLSASSGSIRVVEAVAETIQVQNQSGSIHFEKLEGIFTLSNKSGSIDLENSTGSGQISSHSGSVRLSLAQLTGPLHVSNTSGSIRIEVPENTPIDFYASTNSGSIHTPFDDSLSYRNHEHEAQGTYGAAPYNKIECKNGSGSVRLDWQ